MVASALPRPGEVGARDVSVRHYMCRGDACGGGHLPLGYPDSGEGDGHRYHYHRRVPKKP